MLDTEANRAVRFAMRFRNSPVLTICISLNSMNEENVISPEAGLFLFLSLSRYFPPTINRSARWWPKLDRPHGARVRHFHRRFRGKSPAILRGRFKGADVFFSSLNGKLPLYC